LQHNAVQIAVTHANSSKSSQLTHQAHTISPIFLQKPRLTASQADWNEVHHILANSWDGDEAHMGAAKAEVKTICKRHTYHVPKNLPAMIKKWYWRLKTEGAAATHYNLAGRPVKITQQQVQFCLDELMVWRQHGRSDPYPSIEVLVASRPAVQQVLDESGVTEDTLIKRMKQLRPGLKRVMLRAYKKPTEKVRANRLKRSEELVRYTDARLERLVYIDAKAMPMLVSSTYGWVDTNDEEVMLELQRAQTRKAKSIMLNYYIAVCGLAGAVMLYFYTGTTGLGPTRDKKTFKASVTAGSGVGACLP
jgi:transposase